MSPAGPRGKKRKKNPGKPLPPRRRGSTFDAEPDDEEEEKAGLPAKEPKKPHTNKEMWTQGKKGLSDLWKNYVDLLQRDFNRRTRESQEQLILRLSQVITIGCVVVLLNFFYSFIPSFIRLFIFPVILVISWFVATRAIAPMIVIRFEHRLNPKETYEDEDA